MASLSEQINDLAARMAQECNQIRQEVGPLADLQTTTKSSIVNAINEVVGRLNSGGAGGIDDTVVANDKTWSSEKTSLTIDNRIGSAISQLPPAATINDSVTTGTQTWSSSRIDSAIANAIGALPQYAQINDGVASTSSVWSSMHTQNSIAGAISALTKSSVGLPNVDNTSDINKPVSTQQAAADASILQQAKEYADGLPTGGAEIDDSTTSTSKVWSSSKTSATISSAVAGIDKSSLGLGAVDNTSDANKPVSTAQAAADASILAQAKAYTDAEAIGMWNDRGNYDASSNVFPATGGTGAAGAIEKGNIWTISVAGTLGGTAVVPKQTVRALTNNPGQTAGNWAINSADFAITQTISAGVTGQAPSSNAVFDALAAKEPTIATGNAAQYIKGDKTLGILGNDVRALPLSGLNINLTGAITTSDTFITAYGRLQNQITALSGSLGSLDKTDVGLANVDNTADLSKPVSTAQAAADASVLQQAKDYADGISAGAGAQIDDNVIASDKTWSSTKINSTVAAAVAGITKGSLGLGNVDNTADSAKPVSTLQAAADTNILNQAMAYADAKVVGLWDDRGNYNAASNTFPASGGSGTSGAILKGDVWTISGSGVLGGVAVIPGQTVRAIQDTPGQTAANWAISTSGGSVADAIVDGVTNMAPSQNAVFDALAQKQNVITTGTTSQYFRGDFSLATLDKAAVGLAAVDNTADSAKPVSTAQAAADTNILNQAMAYADAKVVGLWDDRGNYNASGNTFPAAGGSGSAGAILKGDVWTVSVAGSLGGTAVAPGQTVRAIADAPGQTAANWAISTSGGSVADAIVDGVTNMAPSQNAVYDALLLKQDAATAVTLTGAQTLTNKTITSPIFSGTLGSKIDFKRGADIASAATINLDAATGNSLTVTGTTAITAITLADGAIRKVRFAAALVLTNGANLINLGGANIATMAGDIAEFTGEAAGVVRMTGYERANGMALNSSSISTVATFSGTAYTINLANGEEFDGTATGSITFTLPAVQAGRSFPLRVKYGGNGATVSFTGATIKYEGGVVLEPTAATGKIDVWIFSALGDGSAWLVTDGGRNY
jgi:hypothetical protein